MGNEVFEVPETAVLDDGENFNHGDLLLCSSYGSCSSLLPRRWRFNGAPWKKTLQRFSSERKENQTVNITPTKEDWKEHFIKIQ